jgi:hypothetical protein
LGQALLERRQPLVVLLPHRGQFRTGRREFRLQRLDLGGIRCGRLLCRNRGGQPDCQQQGRQQQTERVAHEVLERRRDTSV